MKSFVVKVALVALLLAVFFGAAASARAGDCPSANTAQQLTVGQPVVVAQSVVAVPSFLFVVPSAPQVLVQPQAVIQSGVVVRQRGAAVVQRGAVVVQRNVIVQPLVFGRSVFFGRGRIR